MGTDQKRLDDAEGLLTLAEIVALWVQELLKFDSLQDYVRWMTEDSSRSALGRMFRQIKKGIPRRAGRSGQDESRELLRRRSGKVVFLYQLLLGVNEHVSGFLEQEQFRVAGLTTGLQAVNGRARSLVAMYGFWKELAVTPYPLDPDIAAAVRTARKNDVTAIDDLALEMADHSADQVTHEEGSSESACARLKRAVPDLCCSGLVKRGWRVDLGPSPMEFLANPPLIDAVWIDQVAIELAEFAALLRERGIDLEVADPHPLAPLQPRRRREVAGKLVAEIPSADEIADARTEAAARVSTFTGRTKEIDGRPYIHLDDYRAWSGRKAGGDLEVVEGIITRSWNTWVEAGGDAPELAGIRVGKLDPGLDEDAFFSCGNPEHRRRREARASTIRTLTDSREVSSLESRLRSCRAGICSSLSDVRATATAMQRITSRYFPGLKILFKSYESGLNQLAADAGLLADAYNELADYIEAHQDGIIFGTRFAGRIERNAPDQAAEDTAAALVTHAVRLAEVERHLFFDEHRRAAEILKPMIRDEMSQGQGPSA